jgi:hypothetical protein
MKHNVSHNPGLSPHSARGKRTVRRALLRHWPLLWLVTAALALGVCGSLAAYTSYTSSKSVVSTQVSSDLQFSSNYMSAYKMLSDSPENVECETRSLSVSSVVTVSVCNYDQATADTPNPNKITYTFVAVLVDKNGEPLSDEQLATVSANFSLEILGSSTDGSTAKITQPFVSGRATVSDQVLQGGRLSSGLYRINLDPAYLDLVSIKVYAYPQDTSSSAATGNFMLARILDLSAVSAQVNTEWNVTCTDSADPTTQLDGFNYELIGQLSGELTLSWQTDHVAISPLSLKALGLTAESVSTSGTTASVTFAVSADTPLYLLQFYRTVPAATSETMDAVNGYVWVDFASDNSSNDTTPTDPAT